MPRDGATVHTTSEKSVKGIFFSLWKLTIKCFPSTLRRRNLKTQQSPVILDSCLRKARSGKSHDYRDVIVFEKLRFQNVFRPHENEKPAFPDSSGVKSVFEKLRFRYGLVWTVDLNRRKKAAFSSFPDVVWTLPKTPAVAPRTRSFSRFCLCYLFLPSLLLTEYILWQVMNGRWFAGRRITAERWDGVTSYKVEETDQQREQRLGEWERYLSGELDEPTASKT